MKPPFTSEQFLSVFADYNLSVFPMQVLILLLGLSSYFILRSNYAWKSLFIGIYLGIIWLWVGLVYHIGFFSELNKPAFVFGAFFILQALFIFYELLIRKRIRLSFTRTPFNDIGLFFIFYGLLLYPLINLLSEGTINHTISIGLPCPTTITTAGFLMLNKEKTTWYLFIIPFLWSLVGISAALNFGIYQDFLMLISAIIWIVAEKVKRNTLKVIKEEVAV